MIAIAFFIFAAQSSTSAYDMLQQRLATGNFKTVADDKGKLVECTVAKSTGDADLDRGFCEVTRRCWGDPDKLACMDRGTRQYMQDLLARREAMKATS